MPSARYEIHIGRLYLSIIHCSVLLLIYREFRLFIEWKCFVSRKKPFLTNSWCTCDAVLLSPETSTKIIPTFIFLKSIPSKTDNSAPSTSNTQKSKFLKNDSHKHQVFTQKKPITCHYCSRLTRYHISVSGNGGWFSSGLWLMAVYGFSFYGLRQNLRITLKAIFLDNPAECGF